MSLHVNQGGVWTPVQKLHVNSGGSFVPVKKAFVNQGGTWNQYFASEAPPVGDPHPIFLHPDIDVEYAMHWQDVYDYIMNTAENGDPDYHGVIRNDGEIVDSNKFTKDFYTNTNGRIEINIYFPDLIGRTITFWAKIGTLGGSLSKIVQDGYDEFYIAYDPVSSQWQVYLKTGTDNYAFADHATAENSWEMITVSIGEIDEVIKIWIGNTLVKSEPYSSSGEYGREIFIGNSPDVYVSRFRYFLANISQATVDDLWNGGAGV